jgi:uncharacterized membrane protein YbhN (UPF0104 family)
MVDTALEARPTRRVVPAIISVVMVVFIFGWALPRLADYSAIWAALQSLSIMAIVAVAVAAAANFATYWWVLVVSLPGLTFAKAAVAHSASTAVAHAVPGGGAVAVGLSYAMYSSWGLRPGPIARSVLLTGLTNNLVKFAFPVVALALLAFEGGASAALVVAAAFGLALLAATLAVLGLALRRDALSRSLGRAAQGLISRIRRPFKKGPVTGWDEAASRFRAEATDLLRLRGAQLTVATIASQSAIFVVLLVSLRGLGVTANEVSWIEALAAFSFVRLVSALPVTPGGLGIIELGLLAILTSGLAEGPTAEVAAAILLFRFVTFVVPVAIGGIAYLVWRHKTSWHGPAAAP